MVGTTLRHSARLIYRVPGCVAVKASNALRQERTPSCLNVYNACQNACTWHLCQWRCGACGTERVLIGSRSSCLLFSGAPNAYDTGTCSKPCESAQGEFRIEAQGNCLAVRQLPSIGCFSFH